MPGKLQGFNLAEPLGFGWTRLLLATATSSCHCLRRLHLYTEAPLRASVLTELVENQ